MKYYRAYFLGIITTMAGYQSNFLFVLFFTFSIFTLYESEKEAEEKLNVFQLVDYIIPKVFNGMRVLAKEINDKNKVEFDKLKDEVKID